MRFHLNEWTCERIAELPLAQRFALAGQAASRLLESKILLARCLLAIFYTKAYRHLGSSSVHQYARLELSLEERESRELLLVAQRLESLPLTNQALEANELGWSKLKLLLRRMTPENEAEWLARARYLSVHKLEALVRSEELREGNSDKKLFLAFLAEEALCLLQEAFRSLGAQHGKPMSPAECLELLAISHLSGMSSPDADVTAKWREQGRRDALAEQAALGVSSEENWENPNLEFNESARSLTPAQRKEILRRDRHHCSAPCCSNWLWLQVHHRRPFALGGTTLPDNLATVCTGCHHNLHHGYLFLEEVEAGELLWTDARGRELGTGPPYHLDDLADFAPPTVQKAA